MNINEMGVTGIALNTRRYDLKKFPFLFIFSSKPYFTSFHFLFFICCRKCVNHSSGKQLILHQNDTSQIYGCACPMRLTTKK